MKPVFIAIEGNIGAGKTTLAKILAEKLNASLLLEKFNENPHLAEFYENPGKHALPVELWFLNERKKQINSFRALRHDSKKRTLRPKVRSPYSIGPDLKSSKREFIISDYHISKCLIFAKANLTKEEFRIYEKSFKTTIPFLPQPDLLIYLHQNITQLKRNINKRGREYEKKISGDYLNKIQNGYKSYLKIKKHNKVHSFGPDRAGTSAGRQKPIFNGVHIVDCKKFGFLNNEQIETIISVIKSTIVY